MFPKQQQKLLAVGTLVSLAAAGVFLWLAQPEMSYYSSPSKVDAGKTVANELIRVGGMVKPGSLQAGSGSAQLILTDGQSDLPVVSTNPLPAMLREGQDAVAEGRLVNGTLQAERVFPRFDDPLKGVK